MSSLTPHWYLKLDVKITVIFYLIDINISLNIKIT
jgi:hypothetical protein